DNDCQNGIAPAMKANGTIGAANYYSPNNPQSQTGANGYIPDAKGYPFSVTEFKADATGRIARQGGVGDQYQINSQHETKYYYGTPFQAELDRLFGIDVGLDSHYLKNTVRDANGQYSISYVDAHGRTIATALSGNAPSALGSLNSQPADADILRKKLNSTVIDDIALKATLSYTPTTGGEHRLEYLFDKVTLRQDSCSSFCAECAYDLEILVTADDCAIGQIFKGVWKNYQPNVTSCTLGNASTWTFNPTYVMPNGSSLANLKLMLQDGKTLQVSKILRVSESQRELHLQKFLASCTLPVDSFYRPDFSSCLEDNGAPNLTCDKCKDKKYRAEFEGNYRLSNPDASWESMNAAFEAQCSRDCQRDCDALLETMLVDVYPNGQYGLKDNTNEPLDEFSVYNDNYWRNVNYTDRNGNPIRVNINGIDFNPTELTIAEFRRRFQRDWAYALVHKHPEYCYYEWCRDNSQEENVFGDTLSFNTFMRFVSTQISNVSDHEELKELFADRSFISTLVRDNINPDLFGVINTADPRTGMSIGDLAATLVFCTSQNAQNTGGGADCKPWKLFLENQCEKKFKLFYQRLHTFYIANRRNALLKLRDEKISETCRMTRQKVIDFNRANRANPESEEKDKELRVFDWSQLPIPTDVDQATQQSQQDLELAYKENCEGNAEFWLQQLNVATTDPLYDKMKAYFTKVCAAGADQQHPNGSFDVKKDENGNYTTCVEVTAEDMINGNSVCFRSIIEVYQYFMPTRAQKICNLEDSYYNLTTPGWYGKQYEPLQINNLLEDKYAICERLKFLRNQECLSEEHRQNDTAFVEYINTLSAVQMSVEELKMLMSACDPQAPDCDKDFGDDHVMVSPALQTGVCKSCEEIEKVVAGFECNNLVSFVDYKALLIKYLNHKLGFNLTELEYSTFFDKCKKRKEYLSGEIYFDSPTPQELQAIEPIPCEPMLCPNSEREMYEEVDDVSCADRVRDEARIRAIEAHAQYIEQRKREFVAWYNQKCIDGAKEKESFTFIAPMKMHHYTLYYYDQAGNLVKTVPPAGVVLLTPAQCQAVENLRKSGENFDAGYHPQWGTVRPYHHLKTLYWFNSLNQVIKQNTGEAGDAHFWYDALGRLVLSQNAKQYDEGKLSYTKFDALGRTIEVGQIHTPHNGIGPITLPDVSIESGYEQ
ncbi:MAG: hypothetical protein RL757_668, partial [Bacteroidota bacterium]